ncbi:hemerythrin domain-containing protein [Streptomyces sp. NPDC007971]|uniref:hemerythrin domain-containing protein n=1 Tax=Streptomyces sp. NPDC007971 TaxID=3364799 RepID=UPI0036E6B9C3
MIHQVFRRESHLPAELVQDVRPADTAHARILAEHWRLCVVGLDAHHTGEDEMLWPVLLPPEPRCRAGPGDGGAALRATEGIAEVQGLMDRWQAQALPEDRDELAEALRRHHR